MVHVLAYVIHITSSPLTFLNVMISFVQRQKQLKKKNMRKRKALVFDCDGTLVNSIPRGFQATCQVFKEAGMPAPSFKDFFTNLCFPPLAYYRAGGVLLSDEKIWEIYLRHANHHTAELFPDTMSTLTKLASRAAELNIVYFGILSANHSDILETLLEKRDIRKFFNEVKGDVEDKCAELKRIALTHNVEHTSVVWVGDFPCDMRDGDKAGVFSVGVAQCMPDERNLTSLLRQAGADHCIKNLQELEDVLTAIL
jgi:phosphoglycolate phosphatase-like HAD superfamily hydrolase